MKVYKTIIHAVDPKTGDLTVFEGPPVVADTESEAQEACSKYFPYAEPVLEDVDNSLLVKALSL